MKIPTALRGLDLIHDPLLNKGTAFTQEERDTLGLQGLLPPRVLTIEDQLYRVRHNYDAKPNDLEKYIYLIGLQDRNETLFYRMVLDNLTEIMPIIYTPVVGEACRKFGSIFRRPRGLYISIEDRGRVREILQNWPYKNVSAIVVTDGERILGLGDLGAHGMGIPIGKLSLYTACGGVAPSMTLPITLDVGTDNSVLREARLYTGLRRPRVRGEEYDAFIEEFVSAVDDLMPEVLLQWEDFATENAITLLERYQDRLCTFNDDIQGTAGVVLATLLSACRAKEETLTEQRLLFFGAGASATGVASLIAGAMERQGLTADEARERLWFVDSKGLVTSDRADLASHKKPFAHAHPPVHDFLEAVKVLRPTGIIGLSTQAGAFTDDVIRTMGEINEQPIIFALSNPTANSECTAEQAFSITNGRVLFGSGSPFDPVTVNGTDYHPSQANNGYIFPGLGLGVVLSKSRRVPQAMFHEAAAAVARCVTREELKKGVLLPPLSNIREISAKIAAAVATFAQREGLARVQVPKDAESWVREQMYEPEYPEYTPAYEEEMASV